MHTKNHMPQYPENIYCAIFSATEYPGLPVDADETLECVLGTLTMLEADVLTRRYKYEMSCAEIAQKYNSREQRVTRIISRAMRRLRHPMRNKILSMGRDAYLNEVVAANEDAKTRYYGRICELEALIRKQVEEVAATQDNAVPQKRKQTWTAHVLSTGIERLGLSVRASNCLYRSGIRTLKDIAEFGDLQRIRNMGEVSVQEVEEKMTAFLTTARRKYDHLWLFDTTAG